MRAVMKIAAWIVFMAACVYGVSIGQGFINKARAHDVWANGEPVPAWVKSACCGPEDVHHLTRDQVHETPGGWRIDGYPNVIPMGTEQPSPDGEYWVFYRQFQSGEFSRVYCFFTPFQGT